MLTPHALDGHQSEVDAHIHARALQLQPAQLAGVRRVGVVVPAAGASLKVHLLLQALRLGLVLDLQCGIDCYSGSQQTNKAGLASCPQLQEATRTRSQQIGPQALTDL